MRINNNMMAMNTHRQLGTSNAESAKSIEKLSSGYRINRAGDDAAGLAISEKMRGQIRGLNQASANAQDGISMIQTAEGALGETHSILQRMKELATQSANGTNTESDRGEIQKEINQLTSEINRIGNTTEFNTQKLLDGGASVTGTNAGTSDAKGVAAKGGSITALVGASLDIADLVADEDLTFNVTDAGGAAKVFTLSTESFTTLYGQTDAGKAGAAATDAMKRDAIMKVLGSATSADDTFELTDGTTRTVELSEVANVRISDEGIFSISSKIGGATIEIDGATGAGFDTLLGTAANGGTITGTGTASQEATLFGSKAINAGDVLDTKDWAGKSFTVKYNGQEANITIPTNPTIAGADKTKMLASELVTALNASLTSTFGTSVTASIATNPNNINDDKTYFQFETTTTAVDDAKGVGPEFSISGDNLDKILGSVAAGSSEVGGTFGSKFQIGANQGQSFALEVGDMRAQSLGISGASSGGNHKEVTDAKFTAVKGASNGTDSVSTEYALDVATHETATAAITVLDKAIQSVSAQRSDLGAFQNRLEHTIKNLDTSSENLQAAESRIRDVDMAKEMMEQTKQNILSQAATAMLAQANQAPQGVLQLLR